MNIHEELKGLRTELESWQARLDHLRVKADLGRMEVRDTLEEMGEQLEPTVRYTRSRLTHIARAGVDELRTLACSLGSGFDALQRTHRELVHEAARQRKEQAEKERHA